MKLRKLQNLAMAGMFAAILLLLNACSSSTPKPVVDRSLETYPPIQDRDAETGIDVERFRDDPSVRSLREVEALAATMDDYDQALALEILRSLESVPSTPLSIYIREQRYSPKFTEWLELALQIRAVLISSGATGDGRTGKAARQWADFHYGHQVNRDNFGELAVAYQAYFPVPSQVAILLPVKGGLSAAANAIRDGIVSAYLNQPGDAELRFYASGDNAESALAAYQLAIADGATQVLGPLHLEATSALAGNPSVTTPLLMLNDTDTAASSIDGHSDLVRRLLLSQSEEAASIANRALAQGYKRVAMIVPESNWGRRVERAFSDSFEQGEGQITAIARYTTSANDHSAMLTQMLQIDASKQRRRDLQSWLGINLTFEASRRDDFDFIFMAARPAAGRELKPLLRFHDAGDIPVYAMGRIYSGKPAPASDQDLNGIVFPTTPFQLNQIGQTASLPESVRGGALGSFFALGEDAWLILPWLPMMQKDPDLWFAGKTGLLRLTADGSLFREPAWASFIAGTPVGYEWPEHN